MGNYHVRFCSGGGSGDALAYRNTPPISERLLMLVLQWGVAIPGRLFSRRRVPQCRLVPSTSTPRNGARSRSIVCGRNRADMSYYTE